MLHDSVMTLRAAKAFDSPTPVLLIEADPEARCRHENALSAAGFSVVACSACPEPAQWRVASLVLSDVPSYHWLQQQHIRRFPPTIVLSADEKAGITACLCGADAWVPTDSDDEYLLHTVKGLLRQPNGLSKLHGLDDA